MTKINDEGTTLECGRAFERCRQALMKKFPYARNAPFVMTVKPGKYAWCSCGQSKKQPFCDGSHSDTGMYPVLTVIEEEKQVAWCGCKCSEHAPFCDGMHKNLG